MNSWLIGRRVRYEPQLELASEPVNSQRVYMKFLGLLYNIIFGNAPYQRNTYDHRRAIHYCYFFATAVEIIGASLGCARCIRTYF